MSLKVIFAGAPALALPTLEALLASQHQVLAVYTQPDRRAGRGRHLQASPIKVRALEANIPVQQPLSLTDEKAQAQLAHYQADVMIVVAYGLLLPAAVLATPRAGCINLHFSLLPRWRGASPIQHALLHGDSESGVSIMRMVQALDAGDIIAQQHTRITTDDNSETLGVRLAQMGAELLCETLSEGQYEHGKAQDTSQVTYAHKIQKSDGEINWQDQAIDINRQVRAYYGWPVAFTDWGGQVLRIWRAKPINNTVSQAPGTFVEVEKKIQVACGEGSLQLEAVQLPGKRVISGDDFFHLYRQREG